MTTPVPRLRLVDSDEPPPATGPRATTPANAGPDRRMPPLVAPATEPATEPPRPHEGATEQAATTGPPTKSANGDGPDVAAPATGRQPQQPAAAAAEAQPAEAATAASAAPAGGEESAATLEPYGRPMTTTELATRLLRHWAGLAWVGIVSATDDPIRAIVRWRPESLADHHAYVRSRAWVPDGHEGELLPLLGALYGHTIGKFFVATGNYWSGMGARPMRLFIVIVLIAGAWAGVHFAT